MTERNARSAAFLASHGWGGAERRPLAGDASFRRYERLRDGARRAVLMDAPPPREDVRPFLAIAQILNDLNLSAPEILARDPDNGFLLLEDLGDDTYTSVLAADRDCEGALYERAVDLLIDLHRRFATAPDVPPYDDARLLEEAGLLTEWYLPAVCGGPVAESVRREYFDHWRDLFARLRGGPATLVLRDYHVDNLMWLPDRPGVRACGLLDFQDAVIGPPAYDLVSLLEDARRDVPAVIASRSIDRYLAAFPEIDRETFALSYAVFGVQRGAKILGIFTRLDRRDGKPDYLTHVPRVWRWLEGGLAHPALAELRGWFDRVLPPEIRVIPERKSAS
jgi:aminoglycoside/choline kinase family phosphotransferase